MNKKDQNNKESDSIPFFVMKSEKLVPVYGDLLIKVINNGNKF